jgi:four helix bundle suffix protein
VVVNILICLIHQADYLLDQQLKQLEQDFLKEGELRERMTRARLVVRATENIPGFKSLPPNHRRATWPVSDLAGNSAGR